jgi:hypothetical protein
MNIFGQVFDPQFIFDQLFNAHTEQDIDKIIKDNPEIFKSENWYPLGGKETNFAVIENQQSAPIAALIEKITNSIDAILTRKCFEMEIEPKSGFAPKLFLSFWVLSKSIIFSLFLFPLSLKKRKHVTCLPDYLEPTYIKLFLHGI